MSAEYRAPFRERLRRASSVSDRSRRSSRRSSDDEREWRDLEAGGWPQDDTAGPHSPRDDRTNGAVDQQSRRPWAEAPASGRDPLDRHGDALTWTPAASRTSYAGRGPKSYTRSDTRIAEDVNERLTDDPAVDASDIEVQVHQGEVTLAGTVTDRRQKRAAEGCAEHVAGVAQVINRLRVARRDAAGLASQGFPDERSVPS